MRWRVVTDVIYEKFHIFEVKKSIRENPRTGQHVSFLLVDGLDWVNIIPLTSDEQVVLIKQYRHGSEMLSLETPGGSVEKGEDPAFSAARELKEETGYTSNDLIYLGSLHPNPAMFSNKCHIYLAKNAIKAHQQALDADEDIEIVLKPLPEVLKMVANGEISHSIVAASFGMLMLNRQIKA